MPVGRLRSKCDGTCAETSFRLSAKRTSPLNRQGVSVQSTTGSRDVRISGSNDGHTMFWGSVNSTGYPLHLPVPPFTSSPVHHRVPPHFNRTLPTEQEVWWATEVVWTLWSKNLPCPYQESNHDSLAILYIPYSLYWLQHLPILHITQATPKWCTCNITFYVTYLHSFRTFWSSLTWRTWRPMATNWSLIAGESLVTFYSFFSFLYP